MDKQMIAYKLRQIMRIRNLKQTDILQMAQPYCDMYRTKLNKSDLSQYINGKVVPGPWKLTILSLVLNVDEAWLKGVDAPMDKGSSSNANTIDDEGEMKSHSTIAERLKEYRKLKNMTLSDLGKITGIPPQTLNRYELEQRIPNINVVIKLSEKLRVNPLWLQGYDVNIELSVGTVADRLKKALIIRNMKQSELVALTGIGKSSISTYISGEYEPKQKNLYRIAKALDVNEAWLMGLDVPMEREKVSDLPQSPDILPLPKTKRVPLLGTIACGEPILAEENLDGYVEMADEVEADFALRCRGDSMVNARILDGDLVFIRQQPDVENGEIAAVLIGDEATLKRVYKYPEQVVLQPENPKYPPLVYTGEQLQDFRILGKAVAFLSRVK